MRRFGFAGRFAIRLMLVVTLLSGFAKGDLARADNESPFLAPNPEACAQLDDKNLQVGPPDAEIVAACAALSRRAVLGQRFEGGLVSFALLLAGVLLIYLVLGVPMRPVYGLLGGEGRRATVRLCFETALLCLLRAGAALAILALLSLPFAMPVACLAMLAAIVASFRRVHKSPAEPAAESQPSAVSIVLADALNDVCASGAGMLGIAVLAGRDPWWLAAGLGLALVASIPAIVRSRRNLRREPTARLAASAVLAAIFGAAAFRDPDLSSYSGDAWTTVLAGSAAFALIVLGTAWTTRTNLRSPAAN